MEDVKDKLCLVALIVIFITLCGLAYYFLVYQTKEYFVQIDNTKVEHLATTDNMKCKYTLTAFDETGKAKEVEFKTTRELREGAYLKLEVMAFRGVVSWNEVQKEELPDKVKEVIDNSLSL